MFSQPAKIFEAMITSSDKQHEESKQLREKQHKESKKIRNEHVIIKPEILRISDSTKVRKETTNKFHQK